MATPDTAVGSPRASRAPRADLRARTQIPMVLARTVRRPLIERTLDAAVRHRLTLVSAGPGWGKTTTAALWASAQPPARVAWLTCEPQDGAPAQFWSHVISAMRTAGAIPAGHPLARRRLPAHLPPDLARQLLSDVESLPEPVVLVLDEFHALTGPDVLAVVDDILRYPLPLHLVLLTRTDPVLGLHALRARGEMTEIVADDLAFDAAAIAALGASDGVALGAQTVDQVLAETGGWAVGVRLRLSAPPGPAGLARTERSAAEYLVAEVLDRQEPRMRQFLLRTSVTASVSPELAAALDPGAPAEQALAELGTRDGFVTAFGVEGTWYRYHPLLREMLQSRLRLEDPQAALAAHRTAARWLARHGEPVRALEHAAACEDWALFGEVFVGVGAACLAGTEREALAEALARVPFRDLTPDAALYLCAGALALTADRHAAARGHIAKARELLATDEDRPVAAALVELLDAMSAQASGDVRRMAVSGGAAVAAIGRVPFPFPALDAYHTLASDQRLVGLAWCGMREGPEATFAAVAPRSPLAGDDGPGLGVRAASALAAVARGELAAGEDAARAVLADASARGLATDVRTRAAYAALAWSTLLRGRLEEAEKLLAHGLAADTGGRDPASETALRLLQVLSATARGHAKAARLALAAADEALAVAATPPLLADLRRRAETEVALAGGEDRPVDRPGAPAPAPAVSAVTRARIALADGRVDAALRTLAEAHAADAPNALTAVEARLTEASGLAAGRTRRAQELVARALDLAAPDRLALPFLTVPTPALAEALARAVDRRRDPLALALRGRLPRGPVAPEPTPLIEQLTERELAILAALPTMESNQEIAEDFYVSVNTVKAHLKSLYRKLGISSRRDAVRRGRELGLLP